jgi:hypothetical protein
MFQEIDSKKNISRHQADPSALIADVSSLQEEIKSNIDGLSVDVNTSDSELLSALSTIYGDIAIEQISFEMIIDAHKMLRKIGHVKGLNSV